jgi:hypothetical protein
MSKPPPAVTGLLKRRAPGWEHTLTEGEGVISVSTLGYSRGDGTRPRVTVEATCEAVHLSARHPSSRRAVVAIWVRRTDPVETGGKAHGWTLDMAWRGRHDGEHVPVQLDSGELSAYLSAHDVDEYLRLRDELTVRKAETAAKTRATKAQRRAA